MFFQQLNSILTKISIIHLNILFLLGLALFGGTIGGRIFQKLRIPQVVGYIVIGILIGESGLKIVDYQIVNNLRPFNFFALGLIGFMVGGELNKGIFTKYGRQFMTILLCEGIAPFIFVSLLVGTLGSFFFDWRIAWAIGILFGAIASATDPASTTSVLKEFKAKGPLTTTITGIVALDDVLALILFSIASSIAGNLSGGMHEGLLRSFVHPIYDIGGSILLGAILGLVLSRLLRKYSESERLLAFTIGTVLLVTGLSLVLNLELLLACMIVGIIVVNTLPHKSKEVFKLLGGFTPPIYVLFFVLIGARLSLSHMIPSTIILVLIYLIGTMLGKTAGSKIGARISSAPERVNKYIALGLFSQAGVAIGLSILAAQYFPGEIGNTIIVVVTVTTFILQLIGPPCVKFAVSKAGEVGLNITEEELMQQMKAKDIMEKKPPLVYNNAQFTQILKVFAENPYLYYPVVDKGGKLLGVITVDNLKSVFTEKEISELLLAIDAMEIPAATVEPETSATAVKELLDRYNLEYLPVIDKEKKLVGFIERRMFAKIVSTKLIELQKKIDSLG